MNDRAEVYFQAALTPSKLETVRAWLPQQAWFMGNSEDIEQVGAFRFLDPTGEVGIETVLIRSGQHIYQVPQTYRGTRLDDAEDSLIGIIEHSALGTRYIYDAMTDPVYLTELERVIRETGAAVGSFSVEDGSLHPPGMDVRGTGIVADAAMEGELEVIGLITDEPYADAAGRLVGILQDGDASREVVLAVLR